MDTPEIRMFECCAGVAGFSLGLRLADPRVRTVGYCERQSHAAAVLLARMEDATLDRAPVWIDDVCKLDGRELLGQVDLFTAGYPCPPYSPAGKGLGDEDERAIWPDIADLVSDMEPLAVLLENVSSEAFRTPYADFRRMGFALLPPAVIAAQDVGAPHLRRRWFALAYRDCNAVRDWAERLPRRWARGVCDEGRTVAVDAGEDMANADGRGLQGERLEEHGGKLGKPGDESDGHDPYGGQPWPGAPGSGRRYPEGSEPAVLRMVDGPSDRVDRLRETGNGLVPAVAAAAWVHFMSQLRKEKRHAT